VGGFGINKKTIGPLTENVVVDPIEQRE